MSALGAASRFFAPHHPDRPAPVAGRKDWGSGLALNVTLYCVCNGQRPQIHQSNRHSPLQQFLRSGVEAFAPRLSGGYCVCNGGGHTADQSSKRTIPLPSAVRLCHTGGD